MSDVIALRARLQALRSKQKRVGPFRAAGIQPSIDSIKSAIAQVDRSPKGQDAEERLDAQHESAVVADDAPTMGKSDQEGA